jgi:acyl-CoA synthetase (NDP forming)
MSDGNDRMAGRIGMAGLDAMMRARRVAVVGASSDAGKIGGKPVSLMKAHFSGSIVPVNPNRPEILGLPSVPRIGAMEEPADLAIVAVGAPQAEASVAECLEAGARSIVLFSAGFGEIDAAGRAAQERIADLCRAAGARLLGPNSLGLINFHTGLYATFSAALDNVWPRKGNVGIASQSGAVGTYVMALAAEAGIGFSHFIATGNDADIDVADCIEWLAHDPQTAVIVAYMEGCRDGDRLKRALEAARRGGKPVIAIKPGSSAEGLAAVKSHTGSLAGSKQVFDAVLKAHGGWPATSIEEAVDLALACGTGKFPSSAEAMIITPSGGVGIMMADACVEAGLALPAPDAGVAAQVKALLPLASTGNPIDTTAQVSNDFRLFGRVIDIVATGSGVPILLIFMAHMGKTPSVTGLLKPMLRDVAARFPDRVMAIITRASDDFRTEMIEAGFLVFEDPNRAVAAVGALVHFARSFARPVVPQEIIPPMPAEVLKEAAEDPAAAAALLGELGIPGVPLRRVADPDAAAAAAGQLGYPVALKIDSPDIQHKTEVGGVHLGIRDEAALYQAWSRMMADAARLAPGARIQGATVSPMLTGGVETIVGSQNDPDLGPVVMFGLGGTMAEALKDVVFAPAPVDMAKAREMIGDIRGHALLQGWRGAAPVDRDMLASVIVAVSRFAAANRDTVESLEVNPFVALPNRGAALDLLLQLRRGD